MFLFLSFLSCHSVFESRSLVNSPKIYTYNSESVIADPDSHISVMSMNLWFSQDVDHLLDEIEEEISNVDVFLIQEATGTSQQENAASYLAEKLGYVSVFTPFMNHPNGNVEFGTAILSRWPLENPQVLILPNEHLIWGSQRMATYALVKHPHRDIHVLSVHLETVYANWHQDEAREEQVAALFRFMREKGLQEDWKIIGGDFNSFFDSNNHMVTEQSTKYGFVDLTADIPMTFQGLWDMKLDYIFMNRTDVSVETSAITSCTASDHFPIWTNISPSPAKNQVEEHDETY